MYQGCVQVASVHAMTVIMTAANGAMANAAAASCKQSGRKAKRLTSLVIRLRRPKGNSLPSAQRIGQTSGKLNGWRNERVRYKIEFQPGVAIVRFKGDIDEHVGEALADIRPQIKVPKLILRCEGIGLVNSIGISTWIAHLRSFDGIKIEYSHVPYMFAALMNIMPTLTGAADITSVEAQYYCDKCDPDEPQLMHVTATEVKAFNKKLPPRACPKCKNALEGAENDIDFAELFKVA